MRFAFCGGTLLVVEPMELFGFSWCCAFEQIPSNTCSCRLRSEGFREESKFNEYYAGKAHKARLPSCQYGLPCDISTGCILIEVELLETISSGLFSTKLMCLVQDIGLQSFSKGYSNCKTLALPLQCHPLLSSLSYPLFSI